MTLFSLVSVQWVAHWSDGLEERITASIESGERKRGTVSRRNGRGNTAVAGRAVAAAVAIAIATAKEGDTAMTTTGGIVMTGERIMTEITDETISYWDDMFRCFDDFE